MKPIHGMSLWGVLLLLAGGWAGCATGGREAPGTEGPPAARSGQTHQPSEAGGGGEDSVDRDGQPLFNGTDLSGWKVTNFGGQGRVLVREGAIVLEYGNDLTGVSWTGDFPTEDYEVSLEAKLVQGNDFFCGLTFPVGDSYCSLIVGGWGGSVVGLSSIDGIDASENETFQTRHFEPGRWYRVRVRVTQTAIAAWIDDDPVVDVSRAGRRFSLRPEVYLSRPLGIASWRTTAALRHLRWRLLDLRAERPQVCGRDGRRDLFS